MNYDPFDQPTSPQHNPHEDVKSAVKATTAQDHSPTANEMPSTHNPNFYYDS